MIKFLLISIIVTASLSLNAQNYDISFTASGESNSIGSIIATNLSTNESLTLQGSDMLQLQATSTDITKISNDTDIKLYPNPYNSLSNLELQLDKNQTVLIALTNLSGKTLIQYKQELNASTHKFNIATAHAGIYLLSIRTEKKTICKKIIQNQASQNLIKHLGSEPNNISSRSSLKAANNVLSFTPGDVISYRFVSGNFTTIINEIPTSSKVINAEFVECSDYEGNHYAVVKIGNQWWMAENLRSTKYADGTSIPHVTSDEDWAAMRGMGGSTERAYCYFNNSEASNDVLYTYSAATNNAPYDGVNYAQGIAPNGWHIPGNAEWYELRDYLIDNGHNYDGSSSGSYIAKSLASNSGWDTNDKEGSPGYNQLTNNKSGFNALPTGFRKDYYGRFHFNSRKYARWWSRPIGNSGRTNFGLNYSSLYFFTDGDNTGNSCGFSVRCVKN
ncbi:FISUMP domain-containing protein [Carboxylicivirga sp. N1Y90]|uniref:FISUMP domain-containing protein n=1 Tax=Carboxylicivirga fragile TaxID=3417571 RepID=UPI003D342F80|nr:T9SS type A sorting domain-containing protein [Marinilabiliaceae bacterium N1Y90]